LIFATGTGQNGVSIAIVSSAKNLDGASEFCSYAIEKELRIQQMMLFKQNLAQ